MSREEKVYDELIKFVHWLAKQNEDLQNPMMWADEIVGELLIELAKGLDHYAELPEDELLKVLRKMMDNRISELKYKYYITHRKGHVGSVSTQDSAVAETVESDGASPEEVVLSRERVKAVREKLSPIARDVLDVVLQWDDRLAQVMELSIIRAKFVYKKTSKVKVRPHNVADALFMDDKQVKHAFREIKAVYREVREKYG